MNKRAWLVLFAVLFLFVYCKDKDEARGAPPQSQSVEISGLQAKAPFAGRIVFQSDMDGDNEIYLLTSQELKKLTDNSWQDSYPRWSPDGQRIALTADRDGNYDIFIMDADGDNLTRVTTSDADEMDPTWFSDGITLIYTRVEKKQLGKRSSLWMVDLESKEQKRVIPDFSGNNTLADISPGAPLVVFTGKKMMGWDVFLFEMNNRTVKQLTDGGKSCRPRFSPDGRSVVFVCHKDDKKGDIWTMNRDGSGQQRIMERESTHDYFPSWSPDGQAVVFCSNLKSQYAHIGDWALYLIKLGDRTARLLFDSPGRDVFPDWAE